MDRRVDEDVFGALEMLLLVARESVSLATLAEVVGVSEAKADTMLRAVIADYRGEGRAHTCGFYLREVGGGWRLYINPRFANVVSARVTAENSEWLLVAVLETLATVAYRQPVTRAQIVATRDASVDSVVRTFMTRGLVIETGAAIAPDTALYDTTGYFPGIMGMDSLAELASLMPYLPEAYDLQGEDMQRQTHTFPRGSGSRKFWPATAWEAVAPAKAS